MFTSERIIPEVALDDFLLIHLKSEPTIDPKTVPDCDKARCVMNDCGQVVYIELYQGEEVVRRYGAGFGVGLYEFSGYSDNAVCGDYILVHQDQRRCVYVGDVIRNHRGDEEVVMSWRGPAHSSSAGRVRTGHGEFYPSGYGCYLVPVKESAR